jgi:putative ABC transport system permease protein
MIAPRWRKVFRDLWDNKSRTLLVITSIAIGVFAFGGLFVAQSIGISGMIEQYAATYPSHITAGISGFDDDLVAWVQRRPHVVDAQGRTVNGMRLIVPDQTYSISLFAYKNFNDIRVNEFDRVAGEWPPRTGGILLERTTARRIGLGIGDAVTLEKDNGKQYILPIVGIVHDLHVMPATLRPQLAGYIAFSTLEILDLPSVYNQLDIVLDESITGSASQPNTTTVRTSAAISAEADALETELRRRGLKVTSLQSRGNNQHWAVDIMSGLGVILVGMGLFSLILSGFLVVNIISSLLAQQKRQIGMMKVVGGTASQVTGIYLAMVTFFGVLALIVAVPGSMALAYYLLSYVGVQYLNFDMNTFYLPPGILLLEITVGLLVPLLAALAPILSGTRLTAAQAISDYVASGDTNIIDLLLSRLRGLPSPTMLAIRNTFRHKIRLLFTLSTLTLAGTLFMSIVNVRSSLNLELSNSQRMSDFDVQITLDGLYDRAGTLRRTMQVPGVAAAEGWAYASARRIRPDQQRSGSFTVYGIPLDSIFTRPTLQAGRWLQPGDRYNVVVSSDLLRDEPDLHTGSIIQLEVGGQRKDWTIVGVIIFPQPAAYAAYDYLADFQGTTNRIGSVLVRTQQRTGPFQAAVASALKQRFDDADIGYLRAITQDEILSGLNANFDILIRILLGMAILVAMVGGLGLTGMMSLNVLERTREIGVMRAVGASDGAVRSGVLIEGITVGLISWAIAIPLSAPASQFFDSVLGDAIFRRSLPYTFTIPGVIIWLVIILVISTGASLLPAQRASRISVREALAYE